MHRALKNGEIVRDILAHIAAKEDLDAEMKEIGLSVPSTLGRSTARTLFCIALTSRTLSRHALDFLWFTLDDLTPLFKLLPTFLPIQGGYFDGPVSSSHINRFDKYANRVRYYKCNGKGNITTSAYIQLMHARGNRPLLPFLRYLSTTVSRPELQYFVCNALIALCCSPPVVGDLPIDVWALLSRCATFTKKPP
ncbi:hypothetical protein BDZ97DRAFT_1921904 [Flammula alnicola]|nr:hypothetical protein BDZ97DRAFT_1921904 [Flammula alnicola]